MPMSWCWGTMRPSSLSRCCSSCVQRSESRAYLAEEKRMDEMRTKLLAPQNYTRLRNSWLH